MQGTLSNKNRTAIFFLTGARGGAEWPMTASNRLGIVLVAVLVLLNARRSYRRAFCFSVREPLW